MQKLVSVIIPTYNVEEYIEECLYAVAGQSYRNLEIIVVDDGSTDQTLSKEKSIAAEDSRFRILHQSNQGVSKARNLALENATGYYCCFVDGDDIIHNNAVQIMVDELEKANAQLLNCHYARQNENGVRLKEYQFTTGEKSLKTQEDKFDFLFQLFLRYYVGYEVWNKLYLLDIIKENKILFQDSLFMGEDIAFNLAYILKTDRFVGVKEVLYTYRIRNNSVMSKEKLDDSFQQYLLILKDFYQKILADYPGSVMQDKFYLLFAMLIHGLLERLTAAELAQIIKQMEDRDFFIQQVNEIVKNPKIVKAAYGNIDGKMVWRRYMNYQRHLGVAGIDKIIYLTIYKTYRKIRKRPLLDE